MNAIPSIDMLEAAAYALVSERYRQSYLHDIRGGLQTLHSAVELLVRAAQSPAENAVLAEKASTLARRAVQNHEKSLVGLVNHVTPQREAAARVNVGELVSDLLRFAGNDFASKFIAINLDSSGNVTVLAEPNKFRLLLLGLFAMLADGLQPGAVIGVKITRSAGDALIEFKSDSPATSIPKPEELSLSVNGMSSPNELLLALTQQWVGVHGGTLEFESDVHPHRPAALRLRYPLSAAESPSN